MAMNYQPSDPILLGSGELYIGLAKDIEDLSNLTTTEEEALVNIGAIESGANIAIKTDKLEIKSGNRGTVKKITVDKEVRFSTGIMTWIMENVSKYLLGANFSKDELTGEQKMVISRRDNSPIVYLRFVHEKQDGGTLTVNIYKAQFDSELGLDFTQENPVTINYEFAGLATDDLNYIEFIETFGDQQG
ncbi:hypothetical protein GX831_03540 [bacterium]|nr:hypothetical protein [bacterium]